LLGERHDLVGIGRIDSSGPADGCDPSVAGRPDDFHTGILR
jgi:hypothetical protein